MPLAELAWDEHNPGLTVSPITAREEAARTALSQPHVYAVGTHMGCGCPFAFEPDWNQPTAADLAEFQDNRPNFVQLNEYLEVALRAGASVELYNAWDFWLEPLDRNDLGASDLMAEHFVFQDRQHYTLVSG
ncbi:MULTISPECIES: hypothetical protein [Deinococcus]|uniref:Uncharacterized protein n=1 Tax=Deinococcus rufus TaxID=2136097 RepID=A0ABV7Z1U4_9DEIO|nr:hypothetical protein [Deinococcus sp. AB2017081]WQE95158.1 hypothetical protein U2P90_17500 [Deinococcus sp. AB2017081]